MAGALTRISGYLIGSEKTKLDSVAIGADVTSANPPQTHGASVHNDRLRQIWLNNPHYTTGGRELFGVSLDKDVQEGNYYIIRLPTDFATFNNLYVYYFADVGSNAVVLHIRTRYGSENEAHDTHTDSDLTNIVNIADTNVHKFITSGLLASVTTNDVIQVEVARSATHGNDTNTGDLVIMGILIEYTADM